MIYGHIYKIPFPNGKCYIGLTARTLEERWKGHNGKAKSGDMKEVYKAIREFKMIDTFQMIEIDTAETKEELCEKEIAYIEIHNSHYIRGNGCNMTDGGDSCYEYTEEDRQKMSESQKNYHKNNPEARQKQSETIKKYFKDNPEAGKVHGEYMKQYHKDNPEAGKAHGDYMKQYYEDNPEARQKCSEALKKRYEDPEEIRKCSEAQKKRYEDPEEIRKNSETTKKYFKDNPEARRRQSKYEPFNVFKKDGTYIKSFDYQFEAMEYLQKTYDIKTTIKISAVLKGKRKSSHGFIFKYKD
jgi:hypothetical protein